jgi:5S rRNA maturation endonuclease (ribonuclease M5)
MSADQRYVYFDEQGSPLFRVCRTRGKRFFQEAYVDGSFVRGLGEVRRVLYRLPEIRELTEAGDNRPVYLCEGEKDADRLAELGLVATTAPMGAGARWLDEYTSQLSGALQVIILPDNDDPGRAHAEKVARELDAAGIEVRVLELPDLPEKGDVSDWLDAGGTLEDLEREVRRCLTWLPFDEASSPQAPKESEDKTQAGRLVAIGTERFELGVSDKGECFAIDHSGPRIAVPFRGSSQAMRSKLSQLYFEQEGRVPRSGALVDAMNILQGIAQSKLPTPLHLRFAPHGDLIYLDLGNREGDVVRVGPEGWELVEGPIPVTFRRSVLTAPMPIPVQGGSLDALRAFFNVDDGSWELIRGYAVAALFTDVPQPILILEGEQGSGKSGAARRLATLLDPSPASLRSAPRDEKEWTVTATGSVVIVLDNMSGVPTWLSNSLCRSVTGDATIRRQLYTDSDLVVTGFRRVVIMTGIELSHLPPDLVDRALRVELSAITPDKRRSETELDRAFEDEHALILGALLDLAGRAMRHKTSADDVGVLPRMADHALILAALDKGAGGSHLEAFMAASRSATADLAEGDELCEAILDFMAARTEWSGTASELLQKLNAANKDAWGWPKTASHLSAALKRRAPVLRANGVEFAQRREHTGRMCVMTKVSRDARDGESHLPF